MATKSSTSKGLETPEITVTSVRLEKHKLARFKAVAEANRRSVAQQVRWMIDRAIEDHDEKVRPESKPNGGVA